MTTARAKMKTFFVYCLACVVVLTVSEGVSGTSYDAPDDCEWTFVDDAEGYAGGVDLTCRLNAINSDLEKTNFSVIPSDLTKKLTVVCAHDFYRTSRLEPASFATLSQLSELTLQVKTNCNTSKLRIICTECFRE